MNYLLMDTCMSHLNIGIVIQGTLRVRCYQEAVKCQSELIIPTLYKLFSDEGITVDDLDGIVITKGPGSYTGVRIAMTVAKLIASMKHIPLYTLSTLQAIAGLHPHAWVLLDARSNRAFTACYEAGRAVHADEIMQLADIKKQLTHQDYVLQDAQLIDREPGSYDIIENIWHLQTKWQLVENVHTLVPEYLKEQDAYGK